MKPAYLLVTVSGPRAKSLIREIEDLAENAFEDHTMKHGQPMGMLTSTSISGIRRQVAAPKKGAQGKPGDPAK